jgi:hypothetical protein
MDDKPKIEVSDPSVFAKPKANHYKDSPLWFQDEKFDISEFFDEKMRAVEEFQKNEEKTWQEWNAASQTLVAYLEMFEEDAQNVAKHYNAILEDLKPATENINKKVLALKNLKGTLLHAQGVVHEPKLTFENLGRTIDALQSQYQAEYDIEEEKRRIPRMEALDGVHTLHKVQGMIKAAKAKKVLKQQTSPKESTTFLSAPYIPAGRHHYTAVNLGPFQSTNLAITTAGPHNTTLTSPHNTITNNTLYNSYNSFPGSAA